MDAFGWLAAQNDWRDVTSEELLYEHMPSQSGFGLPVVYLPFDAGDRMHWHDRGRILDFIETVGPGELLDFGPGDGWPSLPVAPFVRHVTGADASPRRIEVCLANAERLGVGNFSGAVLTPGEPLPFADKSLDGVMAASSVEQTPDPLAVLREFRRVLRPGGRLRLSYESLHPYRGGKERDIWAWASDPASSRIVFYDRNLAAGVAVQYGLAVGLPLAEVTRRLNGGDAGGLTLERLDGAQLEALRPFVTDLGRCQLRHPDAATWLALLRQAGFSRATPTHSGGEVAAALFDQIPIAERPLDLAGVDRLVRPLVRVAVGLEAPVHLDSPILAIR